MIQEKESIIRLLRALFPKVKIYLFGSKARGDFTVRSDIDLALDAGHKLSTLEIAKAKNVIEALNIPQSVDIVDLYSISAVMKEVILKEGIEWKL